MSHTFPCPNPVCSHVFAPDAVKGAARLTCPQCEQVFDFRGNSPAAANAMAAKPAAAAKPPAPRAAPVAAKAPGSKAMPITGAPVPPPRTAPAKPKPVSPPPVPVAAPVVPVAMPVVAAPPVAAPVVPEPTPTEEDPFGAAFAALAPTDISSAPDELQFDAGAASPPIPSRRRALRNKKGGRPLLLILFAGVSAAFLFCGGLAVGIAWLAGVSIPHLPEFTGASWDWPQGNCSFKSPGTAWKQDKDLQLKWKLHHAMKRSGPDNYLALYFQDYKNRSPSDAELREGALSRLKANLPESLETEFKPASDKKLGGQPAKVLEFAGLDENSVLMSGECYMLSYQGYAYWFFTWGPESLSDQIKPEWETARQGFALGNARSGWKETGRQTDIVRNASGSKLRYTLKPVRGLWKTEDNAEARAHYEKADQVLLGIYPGEPKATVKAGTSATAQVIVLDDLPSATLPDAIKAAKDFVLEREKDKRDTGDYTYPNTKMDLVQDKTLRLIDDPYGKGMGAGQVQKYVVENDKDRYRYVVLRIVNHPLGVMVLWLECDNRYRDYWDSEFMALLESLEFK